MDFEASPIADCGSEAVFPTVEELISKLRSSFFATEFQYVAKTLKEREQNIEQKYLKLLAKVEEEKSLLLSENQKLTTKVGEEKGLLLTANQKLNDELKKKQNEIDAMRKLNTEHERKLRVYAKRFLDFDDNVPNLEKIAKESMGSGINLENKEQKDRAAESNRSPLFSEKNDSKNKTEPNLPQIILLDDHDDDDDDHKCISTLKRKQFTKETKKEYNADDDDLEFISASKRRRVSKEIKREYNTGDDDLEFFSRSKRRRGSNVMKRELHGKSAKISTELDSSASDSGSDTGINKLYMLSVGKMKKQKERWESESDMVKDLVKDDELCLNGICAIHRQRIIVHGADISR
ncbi:hypothetical protein R6Q57_012372 [Mikania cordata]